MVIPEKDIVFQVLHTLSIWHSNEHSVHYASLIQEDHIWTPTLADFGQVSPSCLCTLLISRTIHMSINEMYTCRRACSQMHLLGLPMASYDATDVLLWLAVVHGVHLDVRSPGLSGLSFG